MTQTNLIIFKTFIRQITPFVFLTATFSGWASSPDLSSKEIKLASDRYALEMKLSRNKVQLNQLEKLIQVTGFVEYNESQENPELEELERKFSKLTQARKTFLQKMKSLSRNKFITSSSAMRPQSVNLFSSLHESKKILNWEFTQNLAQTWPWKDKPYTLYVPTPATSEVSIQLSLSAQAAHSNLEVSCLGPYELKNLIGTKRKAAGEVSRLKWFQSADNLQRVRLDLQSLSLPCEIKIDQSGPRPIARIQIQTEQPSLKKLAKFRTQFQLCDLPLTKDRSSLERFFFGSTDPAMTCPQQAGNWVTLENSIEGFQEKIKALLGRKLSQKEIEGNNPFIPLDFENAPQLDGILISYLVFRNDFSGTLIQRLIEHHASKGTPIRILNSEVISLDKDEIALKKLAERFPNIQLEFYKYDVDVPEGFKDLVSQLHRTNHVKIFLTYSETDDSLNQVMIGGRNIHDAFTFKKPKDLSKFPELVQYGDGLDESFVHWEDFEVQIQNRTFVETIAAQYFAYWDYDSKIYHMRPFTLYRQSTEALSIGANEEYLRHFVSIPYSDGRALQDFYVRILDSAQKSLLISSPYFNLTPDIEAAFTRAHERGVQIDLITRLDLTGDTAAALLSDVNKRAVNQFFKKMTIREYTVPKEILHSKLILVDGQLSIIGSVNLNQRSFFHDTENALLVWSKPFHRKMTKILKNYHKGARIITEPQKGKLWKRVIIEVFEEEFAPPAAW